ncbi:uncharacterized protein METZ01_LOCUS329276, partial [marine metagenome]
MGQHSINKNTVIDGITLALSKPDTTKPEWIGQAEVLRQVLACWMVISDKDLP